MLKNYFKIAWRNIVKHRFYSFLNITGLAMGIVFTFLIGSYVWSELQVNKKLRNAKNQYFLTSQWKDPNQGNDITTLGPLSKRLKEDYPNLVANYYRWDGITSVVSKGDKHLRENIQLGDSTLLSMYGFKLLYGNSQTALINPFSVVITKDIAIKYFGKENAIGEAISIQSFSGTQHDFIITGVLKDIPENSVTHLNDANDNTFFIPTNTYTYFGRTDFDTWSNIYIPSYIELKEGVTAEDLEKPISKLIQQNAPNAISQNLKVKAVPLQDYYLQRNNGLATRMLYALSFVGLFILLMAIINFINISISSSTGRIKEIGLRKVLGGLRKQIIVQFLTESVVIASLATLIALILYPFLQPVFGELTGKPIPGLSSFPVYFIFIPLLLILFVGITAGLYPAIILSALKSADSIKGKLKDIKENIWLRKSLAAFQFAIAGIVMIAAFIVSKQVNYFFSRNLGYNKEYVVASQVPRDWTRAGEQKMESIRDEFAAMPQIADATLSYEIPNGMNGGQPPVYKMGTDSAAAVSMQLMITDGHYINTYQMALHSGSFFENAVSDSGKVVLNEKAVGVLGWKSASDAIGQQIRIPGDPTIFTVKGVTADFHFGSMQQTIAPIIFFNVKFAPNYRYLSFKLKPGNIGEAISAIEKKWAVLLPGSSFEYNFMDDTLKKLYKTEIQLKKASYTATLLSLIIALMGVLGLISLSIQKRTKEIGIRKVLGSSVTGIISLFMKEFVGIIVIAGVVALPLAYIIMSKWLQNYAYRINITAQPFLLSVLVLGFVTALLICIQTIKAALANPVKSLRTE
ncbi:MAG: ABC transporter permease [Bacteroidota bacterium]|nr:ABC transporter permease [Bacteroidota bacterium]